MALPGREDEDAGEVVVVPRHFLFAEEADGVRKRGAGGGGRGVAHEEVVVEAEHVEEDGLVVEEELCEEGEVLRKDLVLLAVDLVDREGRLGIDLFAGRV